MKSINVEGGFYFVEGDFFQIIREMTGWWKNKMKVYKRGGWNIFIKSINVEGGIFQNR